jgi:hypothetical protein
VIAGFLVFDGVSVARAESWSKREDVGVAAVDMRTGQVQWEAWRVEEIPPGASEVQKNAVAYLLGPAKESQRLRPLVTLLPDFPEKKFEIKNPWPEWKETQSSVSQGKWLLYSITGTGVIALDLLTKKEAWRLPTTRMPHLSQVLEPSENLTLIQIGSDLPVTLETPMVTRPLRRLWKMEPHTLKQRVATATLLHAYGEAYLRPVVQKLVEELRAVPDDPTAVKAAMGVEKLLANWPRKRDRQRLLESCVASLLSSEGDPFQGFAWPGTHRVLAWCLLQELIYGSPSDGFSRQGTNYAYHDGWVELPVALPEATKAKLAEQCRKVLREGPEAEKPFAGSVLVSTAIGWNRLTDDERKALLLSADPSVWRWTALALEKHGRTKELLHWARERPPEDHLDVIWVIDGRHFDKPKKWLDGEMEFWLSVAKRDPGGIAGILSYHVGPHPTEFREPISAYLKREIAQPAFKEGNTLPAYSLLAALSLLCAWKNADDTPLIQEYLKHPMAVLSTLREGTVGIETRTYPLRELAKRLLESRGVKVPPRIVYEEVVEPGKK